MTRGQLVSNYGISQMAIPNNDASRSVGTPLFARLQHSHVVDGSGLIWLILDSSQHFRINLRNNRTNRVAALHRYPWLGKAIHSKGIVLLTDSKHCIFSVRFLVQVNHLGRVDKRIAKTALEAGFVDDHSVFHVVPGVADNRDDLRVRRALDPKNTETRTPPPKSRDYAHVRAQTADLLPAPQRRDRRSVAPPAVLVPEPVPVRLGAHRLGLGAHQEVVVHQQRPLLPGSLRRAAVVPRPVGKETAR
mmetsp:Transcript_13972/g.37336  ORF Transcript_13972/g.37336 Transcript_13972/m.37336 type:complete len:247 (+) Transcript_13972:886-1626(+)